MTSWAQKLGRGGRDGEQAHATMLYRSSDLSHANAWVLKNVSNKARRNHILSCFSDSWKYVNSHLVGKCRRRVILDTLVKQTHQQNLQRYAVMYVKIRQHRYQLVDCKEEFYDALKQVGSKEEVKISEWILCSKVSWTNDLDKSALSYENHRSREIGFQHKFLKQCHVLSLVQLQLKSMVKSSGYYAVQAVGV